MDLQAILDAFTANPSLIDGVLPAVTSSAAGKKLIEDRAGILYKENIGEEVKKIYGRIDDEIFKVLGKRPEPTADGGLEKTYVFLNKELTNYKKLLDIEGTLNADDRIKALEAEKQKLLGEGAAKFVKEQWDAATDVWKGEKETLEGEITTLKTSTVDSSKKAEIATGISTLKFNPDISDTMRNMMLGNVESELMKNSKMEDGKVVFLTADGKPILNSTQTGPATAAEVLAGIEGIKEITLKADKTPGGGAPTVIVGKVQSRKDDKGNDVKSLDLGPKGTFTSKVAFVNAFEKGMADAGITKGDPEYAAIEKETYDSHDVKSLPVE